MLMSQGDEKPFDGQIPSGDFSPSCLLEPKSNQAVLGLAAERQHTPFRALIKENKTKTW